MDSLRVLATEQRHDARDKFPTASVRLAGTLIGVGGAGGSRAAGEYCDVVEDGSTCRCVARAGLDYGLILHGSLVEGNAVAEDSADVHGLLIQVAADQIHGVAQPVRCIACHETIEKHDDFDALRVDGADLECNFARAAARPADIHGVGGYAFDGNGGGSGRRRCGCGRGGCR